MLRRRPALPRNLTTEPQESPLKPQYYSASQMPGLDTPAEAGPLAVFALQELKIGRVIGKGGFSVVSEIQSIRLDEVYDTSEDGSTARRNFADIATKNKDQKYVVKMLRTDLPEDEHAKGVVDLAVEADFLQHLNHSNIIKMRAMANSDPQESKFFVILEKLVLTLERKQNFWRQEVGDNMGVWFGPCFGYCCSKLPVLHRLWMERLMVARDIALAIRYLHQNKIVYRDLKPDNVGFDSTGEVKLFDFGLAKRLNPEDLTENEMYSLTGNTGSLRYMAPEVALCEPYDHRVDSYSFGILFWQICSLTTPFLGYSTKSHAERVVRQGYRPKPDKTWPETWTLLMKLCWSPDTQARPSFDHIVNVLEQEVVDWLRQEGTVPSRANEIKAKKRKMFKKEAKDAERLDTDTRLSTPVDGPTTRKNESSIV